MEKQSDEERVERLHAHILAKLEFAKGEESWNALAQKSDVPQSTLATQIAGPKFSLDVLLKVGRTLRRPISYFLPDAEQGYGEAVATDAFYRIAAVVDEARGLTPEEIARAHDLGTGVVPNLPSGDDAGALPGARGGSRIRRGTESDRVDQ